MSKELEQFLAPGSEIPWDSAAAYFVATKEATVEEKVAADPGDAREAVNRAKGGGLLSGIRSSVAQDVTHATRVRRTRGARTGKEVGTLAGAAAGLMAGRKGGVAGKLGGTALGALIGRGAGKSIGEEVDRARTLKRYDKSKQKKKEAEIEKRSSVSRVRQLWKLAQGEAPTEAMEGAEGATPSPGPVDMAGMSQEEMLASGGVPAGPNIVPPSGAPTPEQAAQQQAMAQLEQEMMADELADQSAADHYKQIADEAQGQLQEAEQAIQQAQQAAEQASQQAQMSQQQADAATQQLQQQSQQDSAEKQQLNEEALGAKQNIMQMRQAMTAYREQLQQIALQDPTAQAGPSPEEQGMPGEEMPPMGGEAAKQVQEAQQAEQEAQMQGAQAEQAAGEEQAKQEAAMQEQAAMEEQAMQQQAMAEQQQQAAAQEAASLGKQSSAIPELLVEKRANTRAIGALIGAAGGAGIQALSDRKGPRGVSDKERVLKAKLQGFQRKKNKTVFDKHMMTMTRAMHDTAKINRQHPGSAAAMAAITGAIAGATIAPTVGKLGRMF